MSRRLLNLSKKAELQTLYRQCIDMENDLNDKIFNALQSKGLNWEKFSTHGYYIKHLLTGFNGVSDYKKIGDSPNTKEGLKQTMKKVVDIISEDKDELIELGIGALYAEFKKQSKKDNTVKFAKGFLDEAERFAGLKKMLETSFPGATIKDTSPKNFGDSVSYDMQISFPLSFADDKSIKDIRNKFNINIENKMGITGKADTSAFHFGTVSSAAIAGKDMTYKDFLNQIQKISRDYFSGLSFDQGVANLKKIKDEFLVNLCTEYIKWRLQDNFPVFTSSEKTGVLLCSEVLKAIMDKDMLYLGNESVDPGEQILRYRKSKTNYAGQDTIFDKYSGEFKNIEKKSVGYIYDCLKSTEAYSKIEDFISLEDKISPKFSISLWYGKSKGGK